MAVVRHPDIHAFLELMIAYWTIKPKKRENRFGERFHRRRTN